MILINGFLISKKENLFFYFLKMMHPVSMKS